MQEKTSKNCTARDEYKNCKNKSDKMDIIAEIEQIEEDSQLQVTVAEAKDLVFKLTTRLGESKNTRENMEIRQGYATLEHKKTMFQQMTI
ncbi:hypothetical protein Y032_0028g1821 [Ancylostoma ceylanicum]|uniref:Uncharacterized protein n=1 Tax=Ancylostoma ceylanicum TaxID=53326 RepID=A0A016UTT1_9BILA|nr:hypothetical protein Y032_0028g1821 [Ancylostoma ceylanicum]